MSLDDRPSTACAFPSTHWSAVTLATEEADEPAGMRALSSLLSRYAPALRAYLVIERRMDPHHAEDLVQGFLTERVLERNLLAKADPQRGRLRTFLLACLNRYAAEQRRRGRTRAAAPAAGGVLQWRDELPHPASDPRGADVFEVEWARQVLTDAVARMRLECEQGLRPDLWAIFEGRVLRAAMEGAPALDYAEFVRRFGFTSVAQATNALVTAKRMFARLLRQVVAGYVPEDEVEEELLRLRQTLSTGGGRAGDVDARPASGPRAGSGADAHT